MIERIIQVNLKPSTPNEPGLPKLEVEGAYLDFAGFEGDHNIYRHEKKHDDPDQSVLIMPVEMIMTLNEANWPIKPGDLGENLTTYGIPYENFEHLQQYCIGETIVQISKPAQPCNNLRFLEYVGDERILEFMKTLKDRRGWYATVIQPGVIRKNDPMEELINGRFVESFK